MINKVGYKLAGALFILLSIVSQGRAQQKSLTDSLFGYFMRIGETKQLEAAKSVYASLLKTYPEEEYGKKFPYIYNMCRGSLALKMIKENDPKTMEMVAAINDKQTRRNYLGMIGNALQEKGRAKEAEPLFIKELENSKGSSSTKMDSAGYYIYSVYYAEFLYKAKRYPEALEWIAPAHAAGYLRTNAQLGYYAKSLMENKQFDKAFELLESMTKDGRTDEELKKVFKKAWIEKGNNASAFNAFQQTLVDTLRQQTLTKINKYAVNYVAPGFELRDLNGKVWTLADLKGKIVFIDFWATWCGPCVGSFPVMQAAVDKYKGKVVFLFINSWESKTAANERKQLVKDFIKEKKYRFNVLLDNRTGNGSNDYDVIAQYKVKGIPAKFIIDKTGTVRYAFTGFSGNFDASLMEIDLFLESLL